MMRLKILVWEDELGLFWAQVRGPCKREAEGSGSEKMWWGKQRLEWWMIKENNDSWAHYHYISSLNSCISSPNLSDAIKLHYPKGKIFSLYINCFVKNRNVMRAQHFANLSEVVKYLKESCFVHIPLII